MCYNRPIVKKNTTPSLRFLREISLSIQIMTVTFEREPAKKKKKRSAEFQIPPPPDWPKEEIFTVTLIPVLNWSMRHTLQRRYQQI